MEKFSKEWYTEHAYEKDLKNYLIEKRNKIWMLNPNNLPPKLVELGTKPRKFFNNLQLKKCLVLYPCGFTTDRRFVYVCQCNCGQFFIGQHRTLEKGSDGMTCGCEFRKKKEKKYIFDKNFHISNLKDHIVQTNYQTLIVDKNNLPNKMPISNKRIDYSNKEFNGIHVLYPCAYNEDKRIIYLCICHCGKYFLCSERSITKNIKGCGCVTTEKTVLRNINNGENLIGQQIGLLHVDSIAGFQNLHNGHNRLLYNCTCDCGNKCVKAATYLRQGHTRSCGLCGIKSVGEAEISKFLTAHHIYFQHEYFFPDLLSKNGVPYRFDFAIMDEEENLLFLIEYDGQQHFPDNNKHFFEPYEVIHQRDVEKDNYCLTNNIKLVRISYKENLQERLEEIFNEL